jgi:anti-sigma B factor antagonist
MAVDGGASITSAIDDRGVLVVALAGELDLASVPAVETRLASILESATRPVVVDVAALSFIDSSGIAMLLRAAEVVGPLTIRHPSRTVLRIIDAIGVQNVLRAEDA